MPWVIPLVAAGFSAYQSIHASNQRKKAEKTLEGMANKQQPNQSILDYYNKALAKYNPNPYESASYQQQGNVINRNLATGINASQNKRLGLGAIGAQVQQANDARAQAAGRAESQSTQDLARLGQAAGMKTAEQQKKFDMLYNIQAMKAGQYASTQNTGMRNVFGGLSSAAMLYGGGSSIGGGAKYYTGGGGE